MHQDHLKKHTKEGDISYETLDVVKELKPDVKDSTPEAKAAERWSLTYRYLHKLSSKDKIPSPCKLSSLDLVYHSISSWTIPTDYQRRDTSFQRLSQQSTLGAESSESSGHEPEEQDFISYLSSSPPPDQVVCRSNDSPSQPQDLPDMQAEHKSSTRVAMRGFEAAAVDVQDMYGRTALMRVAENGDQATARLLLEWGAAIDATDENGCTPLMYAAEQGHEVVVGLLLKWGAAAEAMDKDG